MYTIDYTDISTYLPVAFLMTEVLVHIIFFIVRDNLLLTI